MLPSSAERDAVRAALLALFDALSLSPLTVTVTGPSGHLGSFQVPAAPKVNGTGTECANDILYILGESLTRLTTTQILQQLEERSLLHGETTVKVTLAKLVKEGQVTNRADATPRGYALA